MNPLTDFKNYLNFGARNLKSSFWLLKPKTLKPECKSWTLAPIFTQKINLSPIKTWILGLSPTTNIRNIFCLGPTNWIIFLIFRVGRFYVFLFVMSSVKLSVNNWAHIGRFTHDMNSRRIRLYLDFCACTL